MDSRSNEGWCRDNELTYRKPTSILCTIPTLLLRKFDQQVKKISQTELG